ncbi:Xaa-Pro peptidase family protein [Burkholderia cenocepacia]|uniref:Xaa-Pro peptidase family protein n=1 Tax=Burkholderia cenocepacia TaxID=95486 RepID=UPI002AAFCF97|nr:Xaa-Pro peptidase family protein [Burkholderia cenocepacia]
MSEFELNRHYLKTLMDETVPKQQAFTDAEYASRLAKLRMAMERQRVDVVLLSSPESQCWLHGYQARWYRTGSTTAWPPCSFTAVHQDKGGVIVFDSADHAQLLGFTSIATDIRYFDDADRPETADPSLNGVHGSVVKALTAEGWVSGTWGIEMWTPRQNAATTEHLIATLKNCGLDVRDVSIMLRDLQRIKSPAEIEVIREASRILDAGYAHLMNTLHPGMTEIQVWAELEWAMAQAGGETSGLHNTVSRTRRYCHALSSTRVVGEGPLLVDPCGVKHRYHANTARQFYLGNPSKDLEGASTIAAGAVELLISVATVGTSFATISAELRKYYQSFGMWDLRDWIGGYQLGIAFPPDWVGEFNWNVELDEHEKYVEHGLVTNFESFVAGAGLIETIVFLDEGVEVLSNVRNTLLVIDDKLGSTTHPHG